MALNRVVNDASRGQDCRRGFSPSLVCRAPMNLKKARAETEKFLQIDFSSGATRDAHTALVYSTLDQIDSEIGTGMNWIEGAGYSELAHALTIHFRNAGWLKGENRASALWAKSTLAVCSHYHHLVGPPMIAHADCQERLGNSDQAAQLYGCVVKDFALIANEWKKDRGFPSNDEKIALKSLKTAIERLLSNDITTVDNIDLKSLKRRVLEITSPSPNRRRK
jgi:hypothetical protein